MIQKEYNVEFLTPCFCAGANQAIAEIRPASIRGQLRWWFRALGGSFADESQVFGSIANGATHSSRIRIAVSNIVQAKAVDLPMFSPNDPESYVWYYASVSGTNGRGAKGPRWQPKGAIPVGSTFKLHISYVKSLEKLEPQFNLALNAFLTLGALGLRSTRGLGAFHCANGPSLEDVLQHLQNAHFTIGRRNNPEEFQDYTSALEDWARWLRYKLRKDFKHDVPSPLGFSSLRQASSSRQASAVHFRPIKTINGNYSWLAFEAPANRVLGSASRKYAPLLKGYDFSGPAPTAPPTKRLF